MVHGEAGVHRIIIHHQNKKLPLPFYLSVVLSLSSFQGWSESNIRRLLYRLKSCICGDLITKTRKIPSDAASSKERRN